METVSTQVVERESKQNKDSVVSDFARYAKNATRGLTSAAESEGKELIRKMVDLNKITTEQGQYLIKGLMARMDRSRKTFETRVEASMKKTADQIQFLSAKALTDFDRQVIELERRLEKLWVKKRGR